MKFEQVDAKNSLGWAKCVRAIIAKKGSREALDVLDSFPDKLSLQERLLLISLNAEIRRAVEINGEWHTVNDTDLILIAGESGQRHDQYKPFFVMSRHDYQWKYYNTKPEEIYKQVTNNEPEKEQLTDEQKNALILEMTAFSHGVNNGLTFELIEGASFYEVGDPITIKGEPMTFTVVGKKGNSLMLKPKGQICPKLQAYL